MITAGGGVGGRGESDRGGGGGGGKSTVEKEMFTLRREIGPLICLGRLWGLGRLRKYNSLSAVRSPNHPIVINRYNHDDHDQTVPVSRSITILRTKNLSVDPGSAASSPTTSSGPSFPFSPGSTGKDPDVKRFTRKKASEHTEATSPTVYDWFFSFIP